MKLITVLALALMLASCASRKEEKSTASSTAKMEKFSDYIHDWPANSAHVARQMRAQYGKPQEATPLMVIWKDVSPFKRIVVYRDEISHDFPKAHQDVIEHVVDYQVLPDKIDDLYLFDGSISVNRTAGELSSRCGSEAMNIQALNLAHEIMLDKRTVDSARAEFTRLSNSTFNDGVIPTLSFERQASTADQDVPFSSAELKQAQEEDPALMQFKNEELAE